MIQSKPPLNTRIYRKFLTKFYLKNSFQKAKKSSTVNIIKKHKILIRKKFHWTQVNFYKTIGTLSSLVERQITTL